MMVRVTVIGNIRLFLLLSHTGAVFYTPSVVPLCGDLRVPIGMSEDG